MNVQLSRQPDVYPVLKTGGTDTSMRTHEATSAGTFTVSDAALLASACRLFLLAQKRTA